MTSQKETGAGILADYESIIDSIPVVDNQHYSRLLYATKQLQSGDLRFAPVDAVVYNKLVLMAEQGFLDEEWDISQLEEGLIIHRDFLEIQNEFGELESATGSHDWDAQICVESMKEYLRILSLFRSRHLDVWQNALKELKKDNQTELVDTLRDSWVSDLGANDYTNAKDIYLGKRYFVALPWMDDNPSLWKENLGIPESLTKRYSSIKKINEIGLIFASRTLRGVSVPSHDYFSYAHHESKRRGISITEMFSLTAHHEGSHGPIESQTCKMAGLPEQSFILEGFPSVFGNDEREQTPISGLSTPLTLDTLIGQEEIPEESVKKQVIYIGGARFYRAIVNALGSQMQANAKWVQISKAMFMAAQKTTANMPDSYSVRFSVFVKEFLLILGISEEEIDDELRSYQD